MCGMSMHGEVCRVASGGMLSRAIERQSGHRARIVLKKESATNTTVPHVNDPTTVWIFEAMFIYETLSRETNRIPKGAAVGLPEYPTALGILGDIPILAREVVVLADGSSWLYADDVPGGSVLTPGSLGIYHKCGAACAQLAPVVPEEGTLAAALLQAR
jgi:hypothetical protein